MENEVTREYESQMTTTSIKAVSRASLKIGDNFYTIEAEEKRELTGDPEVINLEKEWNLLFDSVNEVTDLQMEDILDTFKKKKK